MKSSADDQSRPRHTPAPELTIDFDEISRTARMDDDVWSFWTEHWRWMARAMEGRSEDEEEENEIILEIGKPLSEKKLTALRKQMQMDLPVEFETVLTKYCGELRFLWACFGADMDALPESLNGNETGGLMWSAARIGEYVEAVRNHPTSDWGAFFVEALRGRLPFLEVGNGDLLAIDMRRGNRNCPIVYLSHEFDTESHDEKVAANFIDFVTRSSYLGCPDTDYYSLSPFLNKRSGRLYCDNALAKRWRKWIAGGSAPAKRRATRETTRAPAPAGSKAIQNFIAGCRSGQCRNPAPAWNASLRPSRTTV